MPGFARGDVAEFTLDSAGFACTRVMDEPEIWRVELAMESTFLGTVNAYVLIDGNEALVVDTGTPDPYNDTRLMRALLRLGVDPAHTTVFCTHAHLDHAGLTYELALAGMRVVATAGTLADSLRYAPRSYFDYMVERLVSEGCGPAEAADMAESIWSHTQDFGRWDVEPEALQPGDSLRCGRWEFEVVAAPGHAPGHGILWLPERHLAFTGDAVLFNCSTCISFLGGVKDPLGDQLHTLEKLADMGIKRAFLGHGAQKGDVAARCRENIAHHERRLERARLEAKKRPGSTAFELAPALGWRVPFDRWEEIPAITRWFIMSETIAYFDHLVARGAVRREVDAGGAARYY